MFSDNFDANIYVMIDGDHTYDTSKIKQSIDILFREKYDMLVAKSKVEYAAHSGLIHADTLITEDISKTVNSPVSFTYRRRFCVAWISQDGFLRCDDQADPQRPCCVTDASGLGCITGNNQGTCLETNQWVASYAARYDSMRQSIVSSGNIEFQNLNPDTAWAGNKINFSKTKEIPLDWE